MALSGSPSNNVNSFDKQEFINNGVLYDPSFPLKFKSPTVPQIIRKINQLVVAVTDLQQVCTSLTLEGMETRKVVNELKGAVNDTIMPNLVTIGNNVGVEVTPDKIEFWEWDGDGVLQKGIDPYCCHVVV